MDSIDEYNRSEYIIRQLVNEQVGKQLFAQAVAQLVSTMDANRWLWDIGDGQGGWVKQVVESQLQSVGFHWNPPHEPAAEPNLKRRAVFERDGYMCVNCYSFDDLHVDHIHPKSRGGGNEMENLQTLCRWCNLSKHAMTMEEWEASGKAKSMRERNWP